MSLGDLNGGIDDNRIFLTIELGNLSYREKTGYCNIEWPFSQTNFARTSGHVSPVENVTEFFQVRFFSKQPKRNVFFLLAKM